MAVINKLDIPRELRGKVSPGIVEFAEARIGVWVFGMAFVALGVFFQVGDMSVREAYLYLLIPSLCPFAMAALLGLFPVKPYRGLVFPLGKSSPMDANDPVAMRLVALYKSSGARRYLWRQAVKFSEIVFAIDVVLVTVKPYSPPWLFPPANQSPRPIDMQTVWVSAFFASLGSWMALGFDVHHWCVRMWVAQETGAKQDEVR